MVLWFQVAHEDPATEQLIYDQKWPVVRDMFQLLQVGPDRFKEVRGGGKGRRQGKVEGEAEGGRGRRLREGWEGWVECKGGVRKGNGAQAR